MGKIIGIYKIQSPTGRVYIGQSWDIKFRWRAHRCYRKTKYSKLHSSFKKYGTKNHIFQVLHTLPKDVDQFVMNTYEQLYMDLYRSAGVDLLNLKEAGSRGRLAPHIVELIRKKNIGRASWNKGMKMGPAWNKGLKGVVTMSAETRKKMSNKHKGNKYSLGTIRSDAAIEQTRLKNTGQKRSQEFKDNLSKIKIGNKGGVGNTGKIRTEENRKRISDSLKLRTDNKGESHNMAKLTNSQVVEIRAKYIPGIYPCRRLAKEYGLSKTNILDVVNRKIWTHI